MRRWTVLQIAGRSDVEFTRVLHSEARQHEVRKRTSHGEAAIIGARIEDDGINTIGARELTIGLQVMATCATAGQSLRIRSTTATLSGLSPERPSERSSPFTGNSGQRQASCSRVSISRSVVGTARALGHARATAEAAYADVPAPVTMTGRFGISFTQPRVRTISRVVGHRAGC